MKMYTRKFFLLCLALPFAFILIATVAGLLSGLTLPIPLISVLLIPYLIFSAAMSIWCYHRRPGAIRGLAYGAPIILILFQVAFLGSQYLLGFSLATDLIGLTGLAIFSATYIVITGYVYVFIAEQIYLSYLFNKRKIRKTKSKNTPINGKLPC